MNCFDTHERYCVECKKDECRFWINNPKSMNCTIIASRQGPHTLQEIGNIFGVTRMRICQLEKRILKKLTDVINRDMKL